MYVFDWMDENGELQFDLEWVNIQTHPHSVGEFKKLKIKSQYERAYYDNGDPYTFFVFIPVEE